MFVNSDNYINYLKLWLITLFLLIILIVAVGGLTRLTDSGLSITAWELFSGILPPLNINEWNFYFSEYKKIPENNSQAVIDKPESVNLVSPPTATMVIINKNNVINHSFKYFK